MDDWQIWLAGAGILLAGGALALFVERVEVLEMKMRHLEDEVWRLQSK